MKIIFFDNKRELINTYKSELGNFDCSYICGDITDIINDIKADAIISPANSFANMKGGIDLIYKKIFPKIEERLTHKISLGNFPIASYGCFIEKKNGKKYVEVGNCIHIETLNEKCKYMIMLPTMKYPMNIVNTDNVYISFLSFLKKYGNVNIKVLCPGLGTGIGGMSALESAKQIKRAFIEYYG